MVHIKRKKSLIKRAYCSVWAYVGDLGRAQGNGDVCYLASRRNGAGLELSLEKQVTHVS